MERGIDFRHAAADLFQQLTHVVFLLLLIGVEHRLGDGLRPLGASALFLRLLPGTDLLTQRRQHHQLVVALAGLWRSDLLRQLTYGLVPSTQFGEMTRDPIDVDRGQRTDLVLYPGVGRLRDRRNFETQPLDALVNRLAEFTSAFESVGLLKDWICTAL